MPSLTVIGLDAATLEVIRPLTDAGELPAISRILDGSAGVLRSTTHPLTPHAWVTLFTGVNAARHGVWDFFERDETGYGLTLVNGSHRRAPAVWDHLARTGRRVALVGVPFTWPAPSVRGCVVSGFDTPPGGDGGVHPVELATEIRERFPDVRLDDESPVDRDGNPDFDIVRRACEQKTELALWIAERFDPDLLFVVYMAADYVHHACWPEWEERGAASRVAETYRILDGAVSALAELGGDVMLVSDHGAGPLHGVMSLNGWLAQEGYLTYRRRRGPLERRARGVARRLGRKLDRTVVDWSRTRAFAYGMFGNVVVNLRGRERHGVVDPDEYESLRAELTAKALDVRTEDGTPIVAAVHRREDLFHGPHLGKVPDLIVEFDHYAWLGTGSAEVRNEGLWDDNAMRIGARGGWAGSHRHEGLFALAGPSAASGSAVSAEMLDVTPTMLHILGEPVPASLEGRVLVEALDDELLRARPPRTVDAHEIESDVPSAYGDAGAVEERLRDLGYLG